MGEELELAGWLLLLMMVVRRSGVGDDWIDGWYGSGSDEAMGRSVVWKGRGGGRSESSCAGMSMMLSSCEL